MPIPADDGHLHVFVAADDKRTVVARRAPIIAGSAKHTRWGDITIVEPGFVTRSEYPGTRPETLPAPVLLGTPRSGAAVLAAATSAASLAAGATVTLAATPWLGVPVGVIMAIAGGWAAWRRQLHVERSWVDHRILTDREDRDAIRVAADNAQFVQRVWPQLQEAVAVEDPAPILAAAVWALAGTLVQRAAVNDTIQALNQAAALVGPDSSVKAEITARLVHAEQIRQDLDQDRRRRLTAVNALAVQVGQFVRQRQAAAAARTVVRDADRLLGSMRPPQIPPDDPAADLTERTAAVLAAYHELANTDALHGASDSG